MSTLQNTISMIKTLPEADVKFLKPMSPEDFMRDIETAEKQYVAGEYQEMGEALDEICQELRI